MCISKIRHPFFGWPVSIEKWEIQSQPCVMFRSLKPTASNLVNLLEEVDIEFLIALYMPGIPEEVQSLLLNSEWKLEDCLSLPEIGGDCRQGTYADFAAGSLRIQKYLSCECYVGSTKDFYHWASMLRTCGLECPFWRCNPAQNYGSRAASSGDANIFPCSAICPGHVLSLFFL